MAGQIVHKLNASSRRWVLARAVLVALVVLLGGTAQRAGPTAS
jgi:hypothetical protein